MTYSMSTDLKTRRTVWCMNDGSVEHPLGASSAAIAGLFAELYHDEAVEALPIFWED
jgi:hypothetical protein